MKKKTNKQINEKQKKQKKTTTQKCLPDSWMLLIEN